VLLRRDSTLSVRCGVLHAHDSQHNRARRPSKIAICAERNLRGHILTRVRPSHDLRRRFMKAGMLLFERVELRRRGVFCAFAPNPFSEIASIVRRNVGGLQRAVGPPQVSGEFQVRTSRHSSVPIGQIAELH
jgi:hypothetical protein